MARVEKVCPFFLGVGGWKGEEVIGQKVSNGVTIVEDKKTLIGDKMKSGEKGKVMYEFLKLRKQTLEKS